MTAEPDLSRILRIPSVPSQTRFRYVTALDTFTVRLLLRVFDPMLHSRTVSWATRGYQLSTHRHWLHTDSVHPRRPSRHAQFYSELVPAMIPVALLGSAVYMVRP